jgi:hypothetical protein
MNRDLRLRNDIRDMDTWDMGYYFMVLEKKRKKRRAKKESMEGQG